MTQKCFTHTVRIPQLTDVRELVSQYHSLFSSLGVVVVDPFPASTQGFTHPIPEENERLTKEFFETMNVLSSMMMQVSNLTLQNSRIQNSTVTFVFVCNE